MHPSSPATALGSQAAGVRNVIVAAARARHARAAEAHLVSESRYGMGFGTQWRDLLDDARDALSLRGFQTHKLTPGGHKIPVVNGCLVYVWRVPDVPDAVGQFASSPTRRDGFAATPPPPVLFEPNMDEDGATSALQPSELLHDVRELADTMPLVLVLVESTPRQLLSIDWAVAVLGDDGEVNLHGRESIWEPELASQDAASDDEAFDSGTPIAPVVELRSQERPQPDA